MNLGVVSSLIIISFTDETLAIFFLFTTGLFIVFLEVSNEVFFEIGKFPF